MKRHRTNLMYLTSIQINLKHFKKKVFTHPSDSSAFSIPSIPDTCRDSKVSVIALAFFLKFFPIIGLLGTTSVTLTIFGSSNFFSAAKRIPVALVCWVKSYAERSAQPRISIQPWRKIFNQSHMVFFSLL